MEHISPDGDTTREKVRILSWGCGVQSTSLAVMSALGDADPLDAVITADTHWERAATYEARSFYADWLRDRGVRVEIVSGGDVRKEGAEEHVHIPFWTSDGGPLRRQCTRHFKIMPIRRRIRELIGYHSTKPPHPPADSVELWLGISLDEFTRMKPSRVQFIRHRWPLIECRMTLNDCVDYLEAHKLPVPVKSACIGCPYRSASEYLTIKHEAPEEWEQAIAFDEANRNNPLARRGGSTADQLYIYKHGPLAEANLEADAARERRGKQLPLIVCEDGYCMT